MTWHLRNEGRQVNEKRIRRLMRLMAKGTVGASGAAQAPKRSRPELEA